MATLTTLVSFNYTDGFFPLNGLVTDAAGDLFGTTQQGGASGYGTVFEIAYTGGGYASTPTTLFSFNYTDGAYPNGLIADAAVNLFGTTGYAGAGGYGTVFEIPYTGGSYASTPTTLASFNYTNGAYPATYGSLVADAAGDLFGMTEQGGASGDGTVFEIVKTGGSYASTPITLATFNEANGGFPLGGLIIDAAGDLFGTTTNGGANGQGTVFEIAKTGGIYASTPTTLVSFDGSNGADPLAGLIADAAGDLFGTTVVGGANGDGTVFELVNNGGSYSLNTLVSFNGADGANSDAGLIVDAAGNLFGTTYGGGANGLGTVFEIAKTGGSYASTPTTLVSFNGSNGAGPYAGLIADAAGDLFGTTGIGGANGDGTAFELTNTGFQVASGPDLGLLLGAGPAGADNYTNANNPMFAGRAVAGSSVVLYDGTTKIGSGQTNAAGVWTITTSTLPLGTNLITAQATDILGNTTTSPASDILMISGSIFQTSSNGTGNENANFQAGNGRNIFQFGSGTVVVIAGNGSNQATGGDGNDTVRLGNGVKTVSLGNGNDSVQAGNGKNTVTLGNGNDTVALGNGRNTLTLGNGTDTVTAGNGKDTINLGGGNYTVSLGSGRDELVFSAPQALLTMSFSRKDELVFHNSGFDLGVDNGKGTSKPQAIDPSLFGAFPSIGSSTDRFAYNQGTGNLYYSSNGSVASETLVAHLTNDPHLTAASLFFVS